MRYRIVVINERVFLRDMEKIDAKTSTAIKTSIFRLAEEGRSTAQVKRLKSYPVADFRLRVGEYRILFNFSEEWGEIHLLRVLHRSKLY
ncbi:MAG: Type toxin-antitoxin system RelE/ParE family toxin [Patescibacteria group bacterium]|nr:Type toxin-antitoxin system RelE/ParE family toxin [Patescibacteria group bacterium]